jgi:hypothetical protein
VNEVNEANVCSQKARSQKEYSFRYEGYISY